MIVYPIEIAFTKNCPRIIVEISGEKPKAASEKTTNTIPLLSDEDKNELNRVCVCIKKIYTLSFYTF